ncbi:MAG: GNAT family N-acetyltransferase [Anaerolineales bacterium]|nr:GNAT family N-acetyltransferase [Anaerolineales bacterium]
MPIEIRFLQPGDEAQLEHLAADVFDDPLVPAAAAAFLGDARHHLAVAVDQGQVVGFVSAVHYLHPDKPRPEFWINEVGVAPSHQARGIGKALLHAVLERARGLGCAEAWVLTERGNVPAQRLYQALGGEEAPDEIVMFNFRLDAGPAGA